MASADHYSTLGVERGADERDIKKAYFKAIRRFSPENHPEEFKKLREAYEVLGNALSRKDYDALTSFGDEIGVHLSAGNKAMERGDFKLAQAEFKHVLVLQPTLGFARDLLGMAFLNGGQPREALVQFETLTRGEPKNAAYHLHKGYAHAALEQHSSALDAYRHAQAFEPSDTRVLIALADSFTALERYGDALAELDRAIHMDGGVNFQDFVFLMRKVNIQLLRRQPELVDQELDAIWKILPGDGETRKFVATKLMALAADMFRARRPVDANRLLLRARQLDAARPSLQMQFPPRLTVPLRDLPAASLAALKKMRTDWSPTRLLHGAWGGPVATLIGALATGLIALTIVGKTETQWEVTGNFFAFLFVVGAPLLIALAVQRMYRVATSSLGKYTIIHPFYLLQVNVDKVTAWPLVNLQDVSLTHHLQNGSYQHTAVRAVFDGVPVMLSIRGEQAAVEWAQNLYGARDRLLGMMKVGVLEAEEGMDLIPPAILAGQRAAPAGVVTVGERARRKNLWLSYGGMGTAGLLLFFGVARPLNDNAAERALWDRIERDAPYLDEYGHHANRGYRTEGLQHQCRQYLARFPSGPHAVDARQVLDGTYEQIKAAYLSRGSGPGSEAIVAIIDAVRDRDRGKHRADEPPLGVRFDVDVDLDGAPTNGPGVSLVAAAQGLTGGQGDFIRDFDTALLAAVPHQVVRAAPWKSGRLASADVKLKVRPSSEVWVHWMGDERVGYHGLVFDFQLDIVVDGTRRQTVKATFTEAMTDDLWATEGGYAGHSSTKARPTNRPYEILLGRAFREFGDKLATELGLTWPERSRPSSSRFNPSSSTSYRDDVFNKIGYPRSYQIPVPKYQIPTPKSSKSTYRGAPR